MGERIKPASQFLKAEHKENTLKKLAVAVLLALTCSLYANASVTESRKNFFSQTTDISATAIISAPSGDGSYLISAYESTPNCAEIPTLQWIDENGVQQSQNGTSGSGSGGCYRFFTTTWIPNGSCQDAYSIETAAIQF